MSWCRVRTALVLTLLVGTLASCGSSSSTANGRLAVVAAESPWGAIARAIGGDRVEVTSVLEDPSIDPHEYSPNAPVAAAVARAAVVIDNGLGYDTFMDKLLGTGAVHERRVVTAAKVLGVSGDTANPHLWYELSAVPEVARAIEKAFVAANPSHAATFRANLTSFLAKLSTVQARVNALRVSYGGTAVAQTERVAGYLFDEAGLRVSSPEGFAQAVEDGREPSAADAAQMSALLGGHRVAALVENIQTTSKATDAAVGQARRAKVPVVGVSELVLPVGSGFVAWQRAQLDALRAALKRGTAK